MIMLGMDLLKTAFRKLLTYTYFDKSDMVLRRNVALFAQSLADKDKENAAFGRILSVANGENEGQLNEWLDGMRLVFMPKKVNSTVDCNDVKSHVVTNVPPKDMIVDRLLIMTEIPVELLIIDIAWVLLYGYKVDMKLSKNSWGNRIDLAAGGGKVREGNSLFKKYHTQYRWYHSVDLRFDQFLELYDRQWPNDNIKEDKLTSVVQRIYCKYWQLTKESDEEALCGRNEGKKPLPLGLMSARIVANLYCEFNTKMSLDYEEDERMIVGVVNMDIKDTGNLIANYGFQDAKKSLSMLRILDQITNVPSVKLFVLPEMSLPEYELKNFCRYSASKEKAFVAGLEYVVKGNMVFNYTITCLPVVLFGQKDALPIIRLKNHYAPDEIETIKSNHKQIPANKQVYQLLYHWRGHVFTTYYCYELTSIIDRSFFFGKIDAVYCPVFNKDTYYFNNIAESFVRDMHCYFVLSNVSHYGDSRVTMPASHVKMNIMKVKGGNTDDNNEIVLSAELDIEGLREFQKLSIEDQRKLGKDAAFKLTPPGYNANMVTARENRRFIYDPKNSMEGMIAQLTVAWMSYMPEWIKH